MMVEDGMKKLNKLIAMYSEVYYQSRMAEELEKPIKQSELLPAVPVIPPEPPKGKTKNLWREFFAIQLLLVISFLIGSSILCAAAVIAGIVTLVLIFLENDSQSAVKKEREQKLRETEKINEEWEKYSPLTSRISKGVAGEFRKAQNDSQKLLNSACGILQIPERYRGYANVCSLYQYLFSGQCTTMEQAFVKLEREMQTSQYITDSTLVRQRPEQIRVNQPVFVREILSQETQIKESTQGVKEEIFGDVKSRNMNRRSGAELEYDVAGIIRGKRDVVADYGWKSVHDSVFSLRNAYKFICRGY